MEKQYRKIQINIVDFQISTDHEFYFQLCWKNKNKVLRQQKKFSKKFNLNNYQQIELSQTFPKQNNTDCYQTILVLTIRHPQKQQTKIAGKVIFNVTYYMMSSSNHFRQKFFLDECPDKNAFIYLEIKLEDVNQNYSEEKQSQVSANDTIDQISRISNISTDSFFKKNVVTNKLQDQFKIIQGKSQQKPQRQSQQIIYDKKQILENLRNDIIKQNTLSLEKMNKRIQSNRILKTNDNPKKEQISDFDFSAISSVDQKKQKQNGSKPQNNKYNFSFVSNIKKVNSEQVSEKNDQESNMTFSNIEMIKETDCRVHAQEINKLKDEIYKLEKLKIQNKMLQERINQYEKTKEKDDSLESKRLQKIIEQQRSQLVKTQIEILQKNQNISKLEKQQLNLQQDTQIQDNYNQMKMENKKLNLRLRNEKEKNNQLSDKYKELVTNVTIDRKKTANLLDFLNNQMGIHKNNPKIVHIIRQSIDKLFEEQIIKKKYFQFYL